MQTIDSLICDNRLQTRRLLSNHMKYIQNVINTYERMEKPHNDDFDFPRVSQSASSTPTSVSSSSSSSSSSGPMFPLLLDDKKNSILHTMSLTMKKMDKSLDKQLKKTKNKTSLFFKSLLLCRRLFNTIKKPMYSILGIVGIYTSITHLLFVPDNICALIASSVMTKEILF